MKKYLLWFMGAALRRPCSECRYDQDLPCSRCGYPRSRHKNWEGKCMAPGVECRRWVRIVKKEKAPILRSPLDEEKEKIEEVERIYPDECLPRWDNP